MAGEVTPGKIWGISVNGNFVNCQIDATLTINNNVSESAPCKPGPTDSYKSSGWVTNNIDSKSWEITGSNKSFADALQMNNADFIDLLVNGSSIVQVQFGTTQHPDYDFDEIQVFSGEGIISNFTLNAPNEGEGTSDFTITGNGAPTFTRTPVTT